MIDAPLRRATGPALDRFGRHLAGRGVRAGWLTAAGWLVGVGACVAAGLAAWGPALILWLANRALDGLDGPVARATGATRRGAFADITADFTIYAGFLIGVAVALPGARVACGVLLAACVVSGTAFVALSSLVERRVVGGLAEGAETIVAYSALCLLPGEAAVIAWTFAAAVAVTAVQRLVIPARHPVPSR